MHLHLIQAPLDPEQWSTLKTICSQQDKLLLMGNACSELQALANLKHLQCYGLIEDLASQGFTTQDYQHLLEPIDDQEWVTFCAKAEKVVSWF